VTEDIEKLQSLRAEIDKGIRSLDAAKGKKLKVEDVIRRARLNLSSDDVDAAAHAREGRDSCSSDIPRRFGRDS
jgi:hypothetical protein